MSDFFSQEQRLPKLNNTVKTAMKAGIIMNKNDSHISLVAGAPFYRVRANASFVGDDLVITVSGGEKPHVGAVAVGLPRPSLADPGQTSATVSVFALTGHKEDELARNIARELAEALNRNIVVTVGIHVENLAQKGIESIEESCRNLLDRLIKRLSACA